MDNEESLCPDCEGKGKWQLEETDSQGITTIQAWFCATCDGTGLDSEDGDVD